MAVRALPKRLTERLIIPLNNATFGASNNPGPSRTVRKDVPPVTGYGGTPPRPQIPQSTMSGKLIPQLRPRGLP